MRFIKCDVLPIRFALIADETEFYRISKRSPVLDKYPADGGAYTYYDEDFNGGGPAIIVVLGDCTGLDPVEAESMLVHEAVHCCQNTFELINETCAGAELEAYVTQYFFRHLLNEYLQFLATKCLTIKPKRGTVKTNRRTT